MKNKKEVQSLEVLLLIKIKEEVKAQNLLKRKIKEKIEERALQRYLRQLNLQDPLVN